MKIGSRHQVVAVGLAPEGAGLTRTNGYDVYVADLLPGEQARVVVDHVSPHRPAAWARIEARIGPVSADRVQPACPGAGSCGGCTWQHLRYLAQLCEKRRILSEALAVAGSAVPVAPVVAADAELGYRNLGKYVVSRTSDGPVVLGAFAPRTHHVVPTVGCRVVEPVVARVAEAVQKQLGGSGLSVYDEPSRRGQLRYVLVRGGDDERALVGLVTTGATPAALLRPLADALRAARSEVEGVVWIRNDQADGALLTGDQTLLCGRDRVRQSLGSRLQLEVPIGGFFQINRTQAARLYQRVAELAVDGPGGHAVDLYCGAGGIALHLAAAGATVLGIERNPESIASARAAARRAGLAARARFEVASAAQLAALTDQADVIVVNPPRKGLDSETRAALAALRPDRIVYVSCHPHTLARDITALASSGYDLMAVEPFDLMPGTGQVEAITVLSRT
jgi:23S rRNA (uracil1939-C5)-methyltransferase